MRTSFFSAASVAVSIGATVTAFLISPLLHFARPGLLIAGGLSLGIGTGLAYLAHARDWGSIKELATTPSAIALGIIGAGLMDLQTTVETNDRRCMTIQRDMLSARPRIADGPDKFQALGCRPQGTDARIFVPRR